MLLRGRLSQKLLPQKLRDLVGRLSFLLPSASAEHAAVRRETFDFRTSNLQAGNFFPPIACKVFAGGQQAQVTMLTYILLTGNPWGKQSCFTEGTCRVALLVTCVSAMPSPAEQGTPE